MEKLYFRQLLAGRDFGAGNPIAGQMQNFAYLIGDRETGECLVVDPAWSVQGLLDIAAADGMKIVGALATHYHPDHDGEREGLEGRSTENEEDEDGHERGHRGQDCPREGCVDGNIHHVFHFTPFHAESLPDAVKNHDGVVD